MVRRARLIVIDSSACTAHGFWKREECSVIRKKIVILSSVSRSEVFVVMSVWHAFSACSGVSVENVVFATEIMPVRRCVLGAFRELPCL